MANTVKQPPDKCDRKFFKCHPKQPVATVICIVCDSAYHRSEYEKQKNTKYVSENLIICPEHSLDDITSQNSDIELNEVARKVITSIKLKQSEEIRYELLQEIQNKTIEKHNTTIEDASEYETDILIAENNLLKKLVSELQDKNQVLKEFIQIQKQVNNEKQITKKSYAEITSGIKQNNKKVPKIIIKSKNENHKETHELITKCIVAEKSIQAKYIRNKKVNEIEVSCMNAESVEAANLILKTKLQNCEVTIEQKVNPKIKIIGFINSTNMSSQDMEEDINERNFSHFDYGGKILHTYTNNRNKTTSILMEVTPDIYKSIRENNNKLFIGHQCCKTYDLINITPCHKCARYGHSEKKCTNEPTCIKCSHNHHVHECQSTKIECANCKYNNDKYRTNLDTNHLSTDRMKCSILKKKIKKQIDSTDYPLPPILPTWDEYSAITAINKQKTNKLLYQRNTNTVKDIVNKLSSNYSKQQNNNETSPTNTSSTESRHESAN